MPENRPFVLTIAGFDPSGGAGILADIKTFEQHRVHGLSINTGNTIQTENTFYEMQWTDLDFVLRSIKILFQNYDIKAIKIGIVPSLDYLKSIVITLKKLYPKTKIIWDTVLKSTTEFDFLTISNQTDLVEILRNIHLITPNFKEILLLCPSETEPEMAASLLSKYCSVLLKGGHNQENTGYDYLYKNNDVYTLLPKDKHISEKHGSGCVLSSAITAQIAVGKNCLIACTEAKKYTENYLCSSQTKLGYHYV
jgi:hydroxymethylpyrimidine/phosphomethylpyrimidine kinase